MHAIADLGRRCTVTLVLAVAMTSHGMHAAAAGTGPERVPLVPGLLFTTTSHAGLVASTGSVPVADTEIVYSVIGADDERVAFRFSVSAPGDPKAGHLLDGVPRSFDRTVRREDFRSATRMTVLLSSMDPILIPGQTFATTSGAVLQGLHDSTRVAFVLGVNEPEEGLQALANFGRSAQASDGHGSGGLIATSGVAALLSFLGVSRHYYRGTLERVGKADESFSVLLDGRRTSLPAVHARGELTFGDRKIEPQVWWLDDPGNPLTLKWIVDDVSESVTRIDRPQAARGRNEVAEALSGKNCRAELSGVYFTTASAQVLDASLPALERFAGLMNAHSDWQVTIEGHTDNIGGADYNLDLSTRRAAAVREVLVHRYVVAANRLDTRGFGLTRPVETNSTDEGRAHNRRVEVSRHSGTGA
jgi:outer membrane protein OmpA-like peptidoglycan-associated protein